MSETPRLFLRPWRVEEASVQRELWVERHPRLPPHRRIDAEGRPTVADLADSIRTHRRRWTGLSAVELKATRDVVGYCGLVESDRVPDGEPEVAFELLRRFRGQGYASEAARAVLDRASACGYRRVWATVWDWNAASRRVLARLGFVETGRMDTHPVHGTTLIMMTTL